MIWTEIFAAVKLILSILPAEVNLVAVENDTYAVFQAGWTKGAWLTAMITDANNVFPDPRTRPLAVLVLQAMLDLLNLTTPPQITRAS